MTYLLLKGDKFIVGDSKFEVATQAGVRLVGRQMFIGDLPYYTYGESFDAADLLRTFGKDAIRLLRKNHGWLAFREMDWRD